METRWGTCDHLLEEAGQELYAEAKLSQRVTKRWNTGALFFLFAGTLLADTPFTGIDTILLGGPECDRGSTAETVLGRGGGIACAEFLWGGAASDSVRSLDTWSLINGFLTGGCGTVREGDDPG